MKSFAEANKTIHPVESQWHFPIMSEHGYEADTKEAEGFVRTYNYTNPSTGHSMSVTTGSSADYWTDKVNNAYGYWAGLAPHLSSI